MIGNGSLVADGPGASAAATHCRIRFRQQAAKIVVHRRHPRLYNAQYSFGTSGCSSFRGLIRPVQERFPRGVADSQIRQAKAVHEALTQRSTRRFLLRHYKRDNEEVLRYKEFLGGELTPITESVTPVQSQTTRPSTVKPGERLRLMPAAKRSSWPFLKLDLSAAFETASLPIGFMLVYERCLRRFFVALALTPRRSSVACATPSKNRALLDNQKEFVCSVTLAARPSSRR